MSRLRLLPLVAATLFAAAVPVFAEDDPAAPTETDRQMIDMCLDEKKQNGEAAEVCVGLVAEPCLAEPDNQSTPMMGACLDKEATIWDDNLNAWYKQLVGKLEDDQVAALKQSQRAWIAMRDSTCAFQASLWGGGTGAGPAAIECFMRETGHRALFLRAQLEFVSQ